MPHGWTAGAQQAGVGEDLPRLYYLYGAVCMARLMVPNQFSHLTSGLWSGAAIFNKHFVSWIAGNSMLVSQN